MTTLLTIFGIATVLWIFSFIVSIFKMILTNSFLRYDVDKFIWEAIDFIMIIIWLALGCTYCGFKIFM